MSMEEIKNHFESEAVEYEKIISQLIPYYTEMLEATASIISFDTNKEFKVIDLGCGTGTLSVEILKKFPKAKITCVDIAENMLKIAEEKLGSSFEYINSDFNDFIFPDKYDLIVSSLALHHLLNDDDKKVFYNKIYDALNSGGVFINADVITGSDKFLQEIYLEKWMKYMERNMSKEEIEEKWLPNYYSEDRPIPIMQHLKMLDEVGFSDIDVIWKYYNYSVYTGKKD